MKVIRVFPKRTSLTPDDPLCFVGAPSLFCPQADEVHVSVTFTWDIAEGQRLTGAWGNYYEVVRLGGPALGSPCNGFEPGQYIRRGVTFTTRGCNNHCPWCLVPEREGRLTEYRNFAPGNIVQDNNLLQSSRSHLRRVFAMLKAQSQATVFSGGLDARLVDDWVVEELRGLRINQLFLAADTKGALKPLKRALGKLSELGRQKLRVYTMIAFNDETLSAAKERLEAVWELGGMPFAQLYQPPDRWIEYSREWKQLARRWSRPAIMKAAHAATVPSNNSLQPTLPKCGKAAETES